MRCASPPANVADDAVEREVVEADVEQEPQPLVDFLLDRVGDHAVALGELDRAEELRGLADRQLTELVDVDAADGDRERLRPQPRAMARGARHLAHVALDLLARAVALGILVPALEPRDHALELRGVRALPSVPVAVRHLHRRVAGAVEHDLLVVLAQLLPRRVDREAVLVGERLEHAVEVVAAETRPRRDRAVVQREVVVGDDELGVDLEARAETVAALARAVRRVEREVARRELVERAPAVRARHVLRERERLDRFLALGAGTISTSATPSASAQRGLERVGEAALDPARRTSRSTTTSMVWFS